MSPFVIEIPLPPRGLSPNVGSHWGTKAKLIREYRRAVFWLYHARPYQVAKVMPESTRKIVINSEWYCGKSPRQELYRPLDEQNAIIALKPAIDGLVDGGLVPSDAHQHVSWGTTKLYRLKKQHKGKCGIVLTIEINDPRTLTDEEAMMANQEDL